MSAARRDAWCAIVAAYLGRAASDVAAQHGIGPGLLALMVFVMWIEVLGWIRERWM